MCYDTCACVCSRCVRVCVFCVLEPHISAFFFNQKTAYEIMPSLMGSEMCIRDRYHTVPQAPKLSTLWQPLYNSSQQVCVNHFYAFVDIAYACVL